MKEWLKREWFKVGWLIIGIAFVIICFLASQNGRYEHHIKENQKFGLIVDTRKGILYGFRAYDGSIIKVDYPAATYITFAVQEPKDTSGGMEKVPDENH